MLRQRRKSQENMMSEERAPEGVESVAGVASISSQSSAEDIATNDIINNSGLPQIESTPNVEIFEQDSSTTELNSSMRSSAGGDSIRLEERQMPSNTLAERFINFYDYLRKKSVIVKEDVLFLVYFGLHCVQQAVVCSSATWALRLMDRSYNIKEAVTSGQIGTIATSTLGFILGTYEAAFRRNYLSEYTSAAGVVLLAMSAPFIGYTILKQTSGVEMHIGQHIVVYIAGITLSLSPYLIFKFYNTYLTKPSGIVKEAALCFSAYGLQAVISSSGALVLGLIDKSYNIKEAATSALIGTVAPSPLFGLLGYLSILQDNHNNVFEYIRATGQTVSLILIPFIGHEILKQTSGVEMHVGQHITAYVVGYVTLLVPYVILSDMHFANLDRNRSNIQQTPAGLRARAAQQILQPETSNNLQANIDNTGTTRVRSSEPESINSAPVLAD